MTRESGGSGQQRRPGIRPLALVGGLLLGGLLVGGGVLLLASPRQDQEAPPSPAESFASETSPPTWSPPASSPLPIPWNALLRNSLPDGDFLPPEPEGPLLDLTDPEQLAAALRRRGETLPGLYETLHSEQRADLVVALNSAGLLRAHLPRFLTWEPRTELRALLLECTDPLDFATPESSSSDADLMTLLDLPTATPIGAQEWVARMELASRIDPELGAEWVRSAILAFPESASVGFVASILTLVDGAGGGIYEPGERYDAARTLARLINGRGAAAWSAETRIRAYYALSFAPDPQIALQFFRTRITAESDPRAREVLGTLQARLILRTTTLP